MFPNPGAENIITQTIKGLQGTPAYLLIFAVYATAIISIFWLLQTIHDETWALPAFIVVQVVGSVLVAILFDKVVRNASADIKRHQVEAERKAAAEKQRADEAERKAAKSIPETGNPQFDRILTGVSEGLRRVLDINNTTLTKALISRMQALNEEQSTWNRGHLRAEGPAYDKLLCELYRDAERDVFSTSIGAYIGTWQSPLGRAILRAHQNNKNSSNIVTRVFVFQKDKEINARAIETMRHQAKLGIQILVFIQEREIMIDPIGDFTIVDGGRAIGETFSFGVDDVGCHWYFEDEINKGRFLTKKTELLKLSIPLSQLPQNRD